MVSNSLIKKVLKEYFRKGQKADNFGPFIRKQLELIYRPLGMWGQAPNPNDDCETGLGVIGIFPHSEKDIWSVLNRFDTNSKVKTKMHEIFLNTNPEDVSSNGFMNWIEENRNQLFGPRGRYTKTLIGLNMETIISGNKNEEYAVSILSTKFPNAKVKRYCSGDVRDTKKGIDITLERPGKSTNIQVKPYIRVGSFFTPDGDTFFEVTAYLDVNRYSEKNVDVFMFVNPNEQKFILFSNNKNKIGQQRSNIIRFYEPPLFTNMTFVTKQKRTSKSFSDTETLFGLENDLEKNLRFRKQQIEKLIDKLSTKPK